VAARTYPGRERRVVVLRPSQVRCVGSWSSLPLRRTRQKQPDQSAKPNRGLHALSFPPSRAYNRGPSVVAVGGGRSPFPNLGIRGNGTRGKQSGVGKEGVWGNAEPGAQELVSPMRAKSARRRRREATTFSKSRTQRGAGRRV
jgi:hypothetical protein